MNKLLPVASILCILALSLSSCMTMTSSSATTEKANAKLDKIENKPEYMGQFVGIWKEKNRETAYTIYQFMDDGTYSRTEFSFGKLGRKTQGRYKVSDSKIFIASAIIFEPQYLFNDDGTLQFFKTKPHQVFFDLERVSDLDALLAYRPDLDTIYNFQIPSSNTFKNDPEAMKKFAGVWKNTQYPNAPNMNNVYCYKNDGTGFIVDYAHYRYNKNYRISLFRYRVSDGEIMYYFENENESIYTADFKNDKNLVLVPQDRKYSSRDLKKIDDDASVNPFDDLGKYYDM